MKTNDMLDPDSNPTNSSHTDSNLTSDNLSGNDHAEPFNAWVSNMQMRLENVLDTNMPPASTSPMRLHEAMRYSVLGGGKRVRALLAYGAGEFCGAQIDKIDLLV